MGTIEVQVIDKTDTVALTIKQKYSSVNVCDDERLALRAIARLKPAVVLLHYDIHSDETGKYIRLLLKQSRKSKIIVIANNIAEEEILDCFMAGAKGFMPVTDINRFLNKAIKAVSKGEAWIKRHLVAGLFASLRDEAAYASQAV